MGIVGKIFAVLVLLLSLAVAVLSWKLSEQRKLFRSHSEALARGLITVKTELGRLEAIPVDEELKAVSYTAASGSGKEGGSLGFEEYKNNSQSVNTAVKAIVTALEKRQEQVAFLAKTLHQMGQLTGNTNATVTEEALRTSEDYAKLGGILTARAKLVQGRDEVLRHRLEQTASAFEVKSNELEAQRFASCAQDGGRFAVESFFDDLDKTQAEIALRYDKTIQTFNRFRERVSAYGDWNFNLPNAGGKLTAEKFGRMEAEMGKFIEDGDNLNRAMKKLADDVRRRKRVIEEMEKTVAKVQQDLKDEREALDKLTRENEVLKETNEHQKGVIDDFRTAKKLNAVAEDPLKRPVIKELKEVRPELKCDVRLVDAEGNFVILSATNRELCAGVRLVVNSSRAQEKPVRLQVKECGDYSSIAYVISGKIADVAVGDVVYLSSGHEEQVQHIEETRLAAIREKERAEREAEERATRKRIEQREREEAKKEEGLEVLGL